MLVTFKTKAYANIPMLGEVASRLLEMMNYGTAVPGAITVEDVPEALDNLKKALDRIPEQVTGTDLDGEEQPAVGLTTRAFPLIELLQAAVADKEYVRWE